MREYPTDTGPADYVLFVNRLAVGVIEAKRDETGENITTVEDQTARYAHAKLKWRKDDAPLPFLFESTGQIIRFTDERDPVPRSREIFHFFKPEYNCLIGLLSLIPYVAYFTPRVLIQAMVACM